MKIASVNPPPPPREITMTFPVAEGWAVLAALQDWSLDHQDAAGADKWREWIAALDKELRR